MDVAEGRKVRRRLAVVATGAAAVAVTVAGGFVLGGGAHPEPAPAPAVPTATPATPEPSATLPRTDPAPLVGKVRGWPDTSRNRPGVYSWDGSSCAGQSCVIGFMHNGYGSADVTIFIERLSGTPDVGDGWTPTTFAGHEARYRRTSGLAQEWRVEIEESWISVRFTRQPGTSRADLDDAYAILGSMRTQGRPTALGYRLVFALPNGDWDSG